MTEPTPQPKRRRRTASSSKPKKPGKVAPTKAETRLLPPFPGLTSDNIHVPKTIEECKAAADELVAAEVAGFDTEAKPTFKVGQKSGGPHVVQFALPDKAFVFQLHHRACENIAAELMASEHVLKVGFGLKNDRVQIRNRLGIELNHVLDLDQCFRKLGYRGQIGVRAAMGALLGLNFPKSKSITTSNWAATKLTARQLLYAANDAFAALKIMEALREKGHLE